MKKEEISYNNIGICYTKLKKYDQALDFLLKSLKIKKSINDVQSYSSSYLNIGNIYNYKEKYDLALDYYEKALIGLEKYGGKNGLAIIMNNIGMIHLFQNENYDLALEYFKKSLVIYKELNSEYGIIVSSIYIAKIYIYSKKTVLAEKMLLESYYLSEKIGSLNLKSYASLTLSELYETTKDWKNCVKYQKILNNLEEEIFSKEQDEVITEMQTKYEAEKKEEESKLLKLKNDELDNANRNLKNEISERKKAEKKISKYAKSKELLLQEVNHRVKNNLYTIVSILNKEKQKLNKQKNNKIYDPKEFLNELINRVNSLTAVHSLLSSSDWQPVVLNVLFNELTNHFFNVTVPEKLDLRGKSYDSVKINSTQAQQLALVYNEILTNTMKYSQVEPDDLIVNVKFKPEKDKIALLISDNGIGFPKMILEGDYSDTGIGFDLIFGIIEQSLGGTVKLSNDNGAVYNITIKK